MRVAELICNAYPGSEIVPRSGGQLNTVFESAGPPLIVKTYAPEWSWKEDKAKLDGLLDGYGELPLNWRERTTFYRLYHALELWDWFHSIGTVDPLDSIADDLRSILGITRNAH